MFFKSKAPEKDKNAAANAAETIGRMAQPNTRSGRTTAPPTRSQRKLAMMAGRRTSTKPEAKWVSFS